MKEITRYWASDVITKRNSGFDDSFMWTVALNDGNVFCWSVPYFRGNRPEVTVNSSEVSMICLLVLSHNISLHGR